MNDAAQRGRGLRLYTALAQQLLGEYGRHLDAADVTRAVVAAAQGLDAVGNPGDADVVDLVERVARNNLDALVAARQRGAVPAQPRAPR